MGGRGDGESRGMLSFVSIVRFVTILFLRLPDWLIGQVQLLSKTGNIDTMISSKTWESVCCDDQGILTSVNSVKGSNPYDL